jgi:hypothetical protein
MKVSLRGISMLGNPHSSDSVGRRSSTLERIFSSVSSLPYDRLSLLYAHVIVLFSFFIQRLKSHSTYLKE